MADYVDPKGTFEKLLEVTTELDEATAAKHQADVAASHARTRAEEATREFKLARFRHLIATRLGGITQEDFAREIERFTNARETERAEMLARELNRT